MVSDVYESGVCTLPRQHWPSQSVQSMSMTMSPPMLYAGIGVGRTCPGGTLMTKDCETRVPGRCCPIQSQKDGTISTPVVVAKRESSVWPYTHGACTVCSVSELLWERCQSRDSRESRTTRESLERRMIWEHVQQMRKVWDIFWKTEGIFFFFGLLKDASETRI